VSDIPGAGAKAPERPAAEILADIERERSELTSSFESLRGDLDEALDAAAQRAADVGRRARVIGPVVGGLVVAAAVARLLFRRRSRRER
jgi:hypothetical protein